jgi:hypothetical protein
MGTVGKVILGIIGAIVLVIILVVVAGAYLWSHGGKKFLQDTAKNVEQSEKDGEAYGRSVENSACVDESLVRHKKTTDIQSAISTPIFMQGCLKTSKETPGFCTGVPKITQIIDGPKWQVEQCRKRGYVNDEGCRQIMQKVQEYCFQKN